MTSLVLPFGQILLCLMWGVILALVYLGLLSYTIHLLSRTKYKALILISSMIIRLAFFIVGAMALSQHNPARFLWIVIGFICTRFLVVGFVKSRSKK